MKFKNVLIASDYDGTLYNKDGIITDEVKQKIKYFIDNGGSFTVCTGRTKQGFHAYESSYINAPVLLANGAMAYDYATETEIFVNPIGEEAFDAFRSIASSFPNASIEMYSLYNSFVINNSETSRMHFEVQEIDYKVIDDPAQADLPWAKCMIYAGEESLKIQQFIKCNFPQLHFLPTSGPYIEIMQNGVDKGSGILTLAERLGIDRNDVYAVGDGFNDIEMLVAAKIGFVPANGSAEAKAVADKIVRTNDEGAVANVIEILDEIY